jgi:1-deoxy-D-xylulose 5-phosphate reductoisomerase
MTNKDKVIAAFLVSVGLFSTAVATKYVSSLSPAQKQSLMPAAAALKNIILLANTNTTPIEKTVRNG